MDSPAPLSTATPPWATTGMTSSRLVVRGSGSPVAVQVSVGRVRTIPVYRGKFDVVRDETLRDSWHAQAQDWVAWSRATGHDSYWTFHRAAFLPLVPSPGRLTVDIGCGEGRVSRDLVALGHRVVAVDSSPAMCRATAAHPTDPVRAVVADATRLPFATASVDCAVAFMSLHDIDKVEAAIDEIARILEPGGRLVMAIVHPFNSAPAGSYFRRERLADEVNRNGLSITFHMEHRPLQTYTEALADSGFVIERVREPSTADPESSASRLPWFLNVVARR